MLSYLFYIYGNKTKKIYNAMGIVCHILYFISNIYL